MGWGSSCKEEARQPHSEQAYNELLVALQAHLARFKEQLIERVKQDPFYRLMDVSEQSRIWMIRYLKYLAIYVEQRCSFNLLQYFQCLGPVATFNYMRLNHAPNEMLLHWLALHPNCNPFNQPDY